MNKYRVRDEYITAEKFNLQDYLRNSRLYPMVVTDTISGTHKLEGLDGYYRIVDGDYVIKRKGYYSVCNGEYFEKKYELMTN